MPAPLRVRYPKINQLVDGILSEYGIKELPVPVDRLAERRGLLISYKALDDELAGFLLRSGGRMTIGVNATHSDQRQRFTIAHEFGHALLHEGDELHVDRDFRVNFRSPVSSTAKNVEEIEANTFAAALLMPARLVRRELRGNWIDIEDDEQVRDLADRYGVSTTAMTFRLMNLLSRPQEA